MERQRKDLMNQQVELIRHQTQAASALKTALRLARGAKEAPPQQQALPNASSRAHKERARAPDRRPVSRAEAPPAGSARREERPQKGGRSPRRPVTDDQVLPSRGRVSSAARKPSDVHSAARHSFRPSSVREATEPRRPEGQNQQHMHPDDAARRRNSHRPRYNDGHG